MIASLLISAALASPCEPSTVLSLESAAASATQAFAALDLDAFERARDESMVLLPCLEEPITASAASGYYRVLAMDAFIAQDLEGAEAAFGSLRDAYPGYRLSSNVAPRNHPLRVRFDAAAIRVWAQPIEVAVPLEATLLIHGRHRLTLPTDRPAIAQLLDSEGAVSWTQHLAVGDDLPEYEAAPDNMRVAYLEQRVIMAPPHRYPYELAASSGVLLIASGTMHVLAASSRREFEDPSTPYSELASVRGRTNGLNVGQVVTGVAGLALGTVAVVRW